MRVAAGSASGAAIAFFWLLRLIEADRTSNSSIGAGASPRMCIVRQQLTLSPSTGCNKGGDVAGFLHRWDPSFKASDWAALARTAFTRVRGACGQLGKAVLLPPSEPNSSSASATEKQQCPRGSPKWGCSCQDLSDAFGVSGDIRRAITFRYPKGVKDFWLEHKCDTKPRYATSLAVKPLPPPGAVSEEGTHGTRPIAYCVELMPKTARALEKIHAGLPAADQRLVVVDNYAVGSGNPAVVSVADVEAGVEYFGIDARRGGSNNVKVPHVTLDGYSQAKHLLDGPTPIDFVLVDTEGNDPLVLQGGNATLRRARFVAFENHRTGVWSRTPLRSVIDLMDTHGFDCFWTANDGTLWEVTGCYPFVNYKGWSNIGCAKRGDELLKALKILADTNGGLP